MAPNTSPLTSPQPLPLLEVKNLSFAYNKQQEVLHDIHFKIGPGESLGIIGPNGGGKSTLLRLIVGSLRPDQGQILFQGKPFLSPLTKFSWSFSHWRSLWQKSGPAPFAYIPQGQQLNDLLPLSVQDVIKQSLFHRSCKGKGQKKDEEKKMQEEMEHYLKIVGMQDKAHYLFPTLSGGEKQRTLLARALAQQASLIILDEPHTALDRTGLDQIFQLLSELRKTQGIGIVLVDHNLNEVIEHCTSLLCLNRTQHWHDHKEALNKEILESLYHCEFEHLLLHQSVKNLSDHFLCTEKNHPHHLLQSGVKNTSIKINLPQQKNKNSQTESE